MKSFCYPYAGTFIKQGDLEALRTLAVFKTILIRVVARGLMGCSAEVCFERMLGRATGLLKILKAELGMCLGVGVEGGKRGYTAYGF